MYWACREEPHTDLIPFPIYRQTSSIRGNKSQYFNLTKRVRVRKLYFKVGQCKQTTFLNKQQTMFLVSSRSCLCPIDWSQVLSREWRGSWSSADRRCSNYIWMINKFIGCWGALYIRGLRVRIILILSILLQAMIITSFYYIINTFGYILNLEEIYISCQHNLGIPLMPRCCSIEIAIWINEVCHSIWAAK